MIPPDGEDRAATGKPVEDSPSAPGSGNGLRVAVASLVAALLVSAGIRLLTPRLGPAVAMLAGYGGLATFLLATWSASDGRRLARPSPRLLAAGFGWGLVLFLLGGVAYAVTGALGIDTGPPTAGSGPWPWLLPGVALAAVTEEVVFRGRVQSAAAGRLSPTTAVVLQSALFALYHLSAGQLLATFGYGLLLGHLTRRRGLTLALAAHLTLNLLGIAAFALSP